MITCVLANTIHMRLLSEHIYNLIIEYYFMCILSLISISKIHIYYIEPWVPSVAQETVYCGLLAQ